MSPSDTGSKEDRAVLLLFSLERETGTDDFSATLIVAILIVEDLCKIFLKVFHRALGFPLFSAITVE